MLVSLIAAMDAARVIGSESGKIPWDLPRDRQHFRDRTEGRWVLVGRKTYAEMEGWFGERSPLVLTRRTGFPTFSPGHRIVPTVAAALDLARAQGAPELLVLGGAAVFAAVLPWADRLLLTRLDLRVALPDPVHFPDFEGSGRWRLRHAEAWEGGRGVPTARYEVHERR